MKNQANYFEKVVKILKELKEDHPDVEVSKHLMLATDTSINLSDKELFQMLQKHQNELEMNTLSDKDMQKVIDETDGLFSEVEYDPILGEDPEEDY